MQLRLKNRPAGEAPQPDPARVISGSSPGQVRVWCGNATEKLRNLSGNPPETFGNFRGFPENPWFWPGFAPALTRTCPGAVSEEGCEKLTDGNADFSCSFSIISLLLTYELAGN